MATRRAADDDPPSSFQRLQAPTNISFITTEGLHQLLMATHDKASGAVVIRRVVYPNSADNVSRPLPIRLKGVNQPVSHT